MATKDTYHHGNLKAALIAAAVKEITQHGVDGFSLRGVARRAGVSAPAVYRHFEDKDALVSAVAVDAYVRLEAMILEDVRQAPAEPLQQFRAGGIAIVRFAAAHPEHYRVITLPDAFAKASPEFRRRQADDVERKRRLVRAAQEQGLIADFPADQIMMATNALVTGLAHQIIAGRFGKVDDKRATELAKLATQVIGIGLAPRDADEPDPWLGTVIRGRKSRR